MVNSKPTSSQSVEAGYNIMQMSTRKSNGRKGTLLPSRRQPWWRGLSGLKRSAISGRTIIALVVLWVASITQALAQQPYQIIKSLGTTGHCLSGFTQDSNGWLYATVFPDNGPGSVVKLRPDGSSYTILHDFAPASKDGSQSTSHLLLVGKTLFGTTKSGGSNSNGTVFRVDTDGTSYQSLYHFGSITTDGEFPYAGLAVGSDGSLFGTTIGGGTNNRGTVYKIQSNGSGYQVLRHFGPAFGTNGAYLYGGLVVGSNDVLFGTTFSSGSGGFGNIFCLNPDGSGYRILHQFVAGDGNNCYAALTRGKDGFIYGSTSAGGVTNQGTVFKIREDGTGYSLLANIGSAPGDGRQIYQALAVGIDDLLYGVTSSGGTNNSGTLFRLQKDGSGYQTLFHFRTNEFASADLFINQAGEFFGAIQNTAGPETGSLFRLIMPSLRAVEASAAGFHFQLTGIPGLNYTLETTSDLITWTPWLTTNLTASPLDLWDTNPPPANRLYRAR
jgi:uncharacterized repeat protein (TIGR03803 family)